MLKELKPISKNCYKELVDPFEENGGRISSHANGQIRSFDSQAFLNNAKKKNLQNMQLNRQT